MQPHQPRAGISGCVTGKPFDANFRRAGIPPAGQESSLWVIRLVRNRSGSTRTDLAGGQISWILDCDKHLHIWLHHQTKSALITPTELEGTIPLMGFKQYPHPTKDAESILNVVCHKILLFDKKEETTEAGELWVSDSLGIVMRDIDTSEGGSMKWEAVSITLENPKDLWFEVPPGYGKRVTAGVSFPKSRD